MYVYDCNAILTKATKNRSDREMIQDLIDLIEDLKRRGINPGFHFMDNEESTALNWKMTSTNITYQLVPQRNYKVNNMERYIKTFRTTS